MAEYVTACHRARCAVGEAHGDCIGGTGQGCNTNLVTGLATGSCHFKGESTVQTGHAPAANWNTQPVCRRRGARRLPSPSHTTHNLPEGVPANGASPEREMHSVGPECASLPKLFTGNYYLRPEVGLKFAPAL